jgi:SH2 domain-containing protein 4A
MLQQILRDMYVDPDILAELDENQKQTLFCKMREEQVRRWKIWNDKLGNEPHMIQPTNKKKNVTFLKGEDGEPWVWVMGEHRDDKSIEEILKNEAIEKARKMAEKEAEELRKQVEAQLYIELTPKIEEIESTPKMQMDDDMDIYCSVDELREKINNKPNNYGQNKNKYNVIDTRDVLQEISLNTD